MAKVSLSWEVQHASTPGGGPLPKFTHLNRTEMQHLVC